MVCSGPHVQNCTVRCGSRASGMPIYGNGGNLPVQYWDSSARVHALHQLPQTILLTPVLMDSAPGDKLLSCAWCGAVGAVSSNLCPRTLLRHHRRFQHRITPYAVVGARMGRPYVPHRSSLSLESFLQRLVIVPCFSKIDKNSSGWKATKYRCDKWR